MAVWGMLDTAPEIAASGEQEVQRRRLILDAVIACVSEDGIDGATIRRVAERARVSTGMVSYYYPTKRDLIAATIDAAVADLHSRVQQQSGEGPGFDRLQKTAEILLLNPGENFPSMSFWMEFWAAATREPHLGERFVRALASNHDAYRAALEAETHRGGQIRGEVDVDLAVNMISSLLRGLRIEAALGKSPELAVRVFHFALQLLFTQQPGMPGLVRSNSLALANTTPVEKPKRRYAPRAKKR